MNTSTNYNFNLPDYNDTADIAKLSENFSDLDGILTQIAADIADLKDIAISGEITVNDVLLMAHPVGSIYQSANSTSPATLFGGTWQRINDVFLLAAGNDYEAGDTGGSANNMLTVDNLPYFGWANPYQLIGETGAWVPTNPNNGQHNFNPRPNDTAQTSINNMPPYVAVYTWVRTA